MLSTVNEDTLADLTRTHLRLAGVKRPTLYENTSAQMPVGFRSLA